MTSVDTAYIIWFVPCGGTDQSPDLSRYGSNGLRNVEVLQVLDAVHAGDVVVLPHQVLADGQGLQQSPEAQLWQLAHLQQGAKEEHAGKRVDGVADTQGVHVLQVV